MPRSQGRATKHSVVVWPRGNILWLRWRVPGSPKRHAFSLELPDTPLNQRNAKKVAGEIEADIGYGSFDPTLEKYRRFLAPESTQSSTQLNKQSTISLFEGFIEYRCSEGTSGQAIASRYNPLLANLKRFHQDIVDETDAKKFVALLRSRQSPLIANQNLALLKGFAKWAINEGLLRTNPFAQIKPLKVDKSQSRDKPFSQEEIVRFLATIKVDRYYSGYHDFCMMLFYLGLRPSECIGLRWKHIDFNHRQVTICESLSRSPDGKSSGYARQQRGVKTSGSGVGSRVLDLAPKLYDMLLTRRTEEFDPEGLVFTAPRGGPIDDHSFSQRCWKSICEKAGIPYRSPYIARHSLLSHLIQAGATLPQAAYIAGHRDTRMVAETYAHMVNRPKMIEF